MINTTVIVCTKNSAGSLRNCLEAIIREDPSAIYLVDANSTDDTRKIAHELGIEVLNGTNRGLTADRQLGINYSKSEFSFLIDSDHSIPEGYLHSMLKIIQEESYDLVQSKLNLINSRGVLNYGEQVYYEVIHNNPTTNIIPGIAPAVFVTNKLKSGCILEIEDGLARTIDDTNWATKALKFGARIGIEGPEVGQEHEPGLTAYFQKFRWYGIGDGEFCFTTPKSFPKHYFHLYIRYPVIYSLEAIKVRKPGAIPFLAMQGIVRGIYCLRTHLRFLIVGRDE